MKLLLYTSGWPDLNNAVSGGGKGRQSSSRSSSDIHKPALDTDTKRKMGSRSQVHISLIISIIYKISFLKETGLYNLL